MKAKLNDRERAQHFISLFTMCSGLQITEPCVHLCKYSQHYDILKGTLAALPPPSPIFPPHFWHCTSQAVTPCLHFAGRWLPLVLWKTLKCHPGFFCSMGNVTGAGAGSAKVGARRTSPSAEADDNLSFATDGLLAFYHSASCLQHQGHQGQWVLVFLILS